MENGPPEQLEAKEADARTDIFVFGAVLYETLTGRKAFEAATDRCQRHQKIAEIADPPACFPRPTESML